MYVIMDMEWIESSGGVPCPTQIAALRVDWQWRRMGAFQSLIRPRDKSCHRWSHMAFTGADKDLFLKAPAAVPVFRGLFQWLRDDDVLLWWEKTAAGTFSDAVSHMLNQDLLYPVTLLRNTAVRLCRENGNPYQLAESKGIMVPGQQHVSSNDVETLRRLFSSLRISPDSIHDAPAKKKDNEADVLKYLYDPTTNLLHTADESCEINNPMIGFATLKSCLRKGFRPCPVCMAEKYRRESMKLSAEVISRSQYNFIYQPKSEVFHKAECVHARRIPYWLIMGSVKYDVCVRREKRPCLLCNPTENYHRPRGLVPAQPVTAPARPQRHAPALIPGLTRALTTEETRAYNRHLEASRNRSAILSAVEDRDQGDAYTRSCSGFAFCAARGYKTFHLPGCPKLKGLSGLEGDRKSVV